MRVPLGDYGANAAALVLCTVANTVAHRRVTFAGADPSTRTAVLGAAAVLLTSLAFTTAGLAVADWLVPASLAVQVGALLVATGLAALVRFVLLRAWVFRAHCRSVVAIPGR